MDHPKGGAGVSGEGKGVTILPSVIDSGSLLAMAALARQAPPGCFLEVGVYKGGSASMLADVARDRGCALHLFDTFTGIPFADREDSNGVGDFADADVEALRMALPDAILYPGVFPGTLPDNLSDIAFVHCDCDQYRSVRAVIDELWPRMVSGGIMVFDDMNTTGGRRAIEESFREVHQYRGRHYVVKP